MAKEELRTELIVDAKGVKNGVDDGVEALEKMEKAFDGVGDEATKSGAEVDQSSSKMRDGLSKVGETLGTLKPAVQAAFVGAGVIALKTAEDFSSSQTKIQNSFGLTGAEAKKLNGTVEAVWKEGFGDSVEEVSDSLVKVKTNMKNITGKELKEATKSALTLAKTFDADVNEVTRGGGMLMKSFGLSSEEAFDLMAVGAQKGLNFSDEMFDNISEYAPLFKQAGFSADEMFNVLIAGTKDGAYNLDYVNDLVKEFGIRLQDGSKSTSEAMGSMSKETQKMFKEYQKGKVTAATMLKTITKELEGMDDQQKATQLGTALMGTKFEDMGNTTVYAMGNAKNAIGDVSGAMDKMNKNDANDTFTRMKKILRETGAALLPVANIFLDLADDVLPYVSSGIKTASDLFNSMNPEMQKTVGIVLALTAAGSAGKFALGGLTSILGGLLNPMNMFKGGAKGAAEALDETAGKAKVAGNGFAGLGGKIGLAATRLGIWGVAIGAVAVGGYALTNMLSSHIQSMNEDRNSADKWGTSVSSSTDKVLNGFQTMSNGAQTKLNELQTGTVAKSKENVEAVAAEYGKMGSAIVKAIDDNTKSVVDGISKLPAAVQPFAKASTEIVKQEQEAQKKVVENNTAQINQIIDKGYTERGYLTTYEEARINALHQANLEIGVSQLVDDKEKRKAILAQLNGDIGSLSKAQAKIRRDELLKSNSELNSEYEKQIEQTKKYYRDSLAGITDETKKSEILKEQQKALAALEEAHKATSKGIVGNLNEIVEKYPELGNVLASTEGKSAAILSDMLTNFDATGDGSADAMKLIADESTAAGQVWNSLIFNPKTGEVNINAISAIQEAKTQGFDLWQTMELMDKQGVLSTNVKEALAQAKQQKLSGWDAVEYMLKHAKLDSNVKQTLQTALKEKSGKWDPLKFFQKHANLDSNIGNTLNTVLNKKRNVWDVMMFAAKNANINTNALTVQGMIENTKRTWNNWHPQSKSLGINVAKIGVGALESISGNANGSPNFGGLTTLHERGDEIYDLPSGSRIIPHSLSEAMMERAGRDYAKQSASTNNTSTSTVELKIDKFYNNTPEDINSLSRRLGQHMERTKNPWRR
ncbi:hypothetical protein HBP99_16065 [Listeria booriae]|uniref:phage tail tape measure protein n=1 Tax=Listeria booriae TaxID=1552123 RepID=UPI00162ACBD7|nr:phage tail tape measure protein [Listeria booriae]MBC2370146.1 hypothetical protein [Listeria booriae]